VKEPRIKIGYCIDTFNVGGTELNAIRTAEALDRDRFELIVFHLQESGPLRARYEALGVELHHLPLRGFVSASALSQGVRFVRMLQKSRVDIVHSHDVYTNIFAGCWAGTFTSCRIIESRRWWLEVPRPGLAAVNRWTYRRADRVLANSAAVARLLQTVEGVPAGKVVEIPNFVDDAAFAPPPAGDVARQRRAWGIPQGAFVVGIVARLAPVKNHEMLIRAIARCGTDVHAVLVGSGPSEAALRGLVAELGVVDRVHFAGEIRSQTNLHGFFDVSVLCSRSEGFPNSLIEAMALANAVVATPVGGVLDVLEHDRTGKLVPVNDFDQLAQALRALESDSELRQSLGKTARALVSSRYRRQAVIERLSTLYCALARP